MLSEYIFTNCIEKFLEDLDVVRYLITHKSTIPRTRTRKYKSLHTIWNPDRKITKFKIFQSSCLSMEKFKSLVHKLGKSPDIEYLYIDESSDILAYYILKTLPINLKELHVRSIDLLGSKNLLKYDLPYKENINFTRLVMNHLTMNSNFCKYLFLPYHVKYLEVRFEIFINTFIKLPNPIIEIIGNLEILNLCLYVYNNLKITFILPSSVKEVRYKDDDIKFVIREGCNPKIIKI